MELIPSAVKASNIDKEYDTAFNLLNKCIH